MRYTASETRRPEPEPFSEAVASGSSSGGLGIPRCSGLGSNAIAGAAAHPAEMASKTITNQVIPLRETMIAPPARMGLNHQRKPSPLIDNRKPRQSLIELSTSREW